MAISTIRNPRGEVEVRRNYCAAPIGPGYAQGASAWYSLGAGVMDASQAGVIIKNWSSNPGTVQGAGIRYIDSSWPGGAWRHIVFSAYINGYTAKLTISCSFRDANDAEIIRVNSDPVTMFSNYTSTMEALFQSPANTHHVVVDLIHAAGSGVPQANNGIAYSKVLIEGGTDTGLARYFDGNTYPNGNGTTRTGWAGTAGFSQSVYYDADPISIVAPTLVVGYDSASAVRNVVHQLLDGRVTASVSAGGARSGTLRLFFETATAAERARIAHAAAGYWSFTDTDQPTENMLYVVAGPMRKYQTHSGLRWILEVPFAEVS